MQLKVISLNLWNGGRLFNQALDFLLTEDADLMLLQEVYDGSGNHLDDRFRTAELFMEAFPRYHSYFSAAFIDNRGPDGKIENGQLILSKYPLQNGRDIHFDIPYGEYDHDSVTDFKYFPACMGVVKMVIEDKYIKIINNHGPVNNDGAADDVRRQNMTKTILNEINPKETIILAGDFNVQPQTQTIQLIEEKLISVFKDHNLKTTFNLQQKDLDNFPGFAQAAVDYMFVSHNIKVNEAHCPEVNVSDHLPLVAQLEI